MRKIFSALMLCLFLSNLSYATGYTIDELPNHMFLTQHWVSYTTSFDIETKTRKLGSLYRRALALTLIYDFYDNANQLMTTARARFFSLGAYFDVYDDQNVHLGSVEEKIFTFFPSFTLLGHDGEKLARAEMNFWGTTFTIYDMESDQVLAVMSRAFFRFKNDWTIELQNKELIKSKNIDPKLFMTVLAFQADSEYWQEQQTMSYAQKNAIKPTTQKFALSSAQSIQAKVKAHQTLQNHNDVPLMSQEALEVLAAKLQNDYSTQIQSSNENVSIEEKMMGFVNYCLNLVESEQISQEEKKGILYLLEQRLKGFSV